MTAKRKDGKGRGGATIGGGAPKAPMLVDQSSPLMRGLGKALVEAGQPSTYVLANRTGIPRATIAHAILHGRTPAAVRSIERILAALGYTVVVVRKGTAPTLDP
jgi:hypothetical protein